MTAQAGWVSRMEDVVSVTANHVHYRLIEKSFGTQMQFVPCPKVTCQSAAAGDTTTESAMGDYSLKHAGHCSGGIALSSLSVCCHVIHLNPDMKLQAV